MAGSTDMKQLFFFLILITLSSVSQGMWPEGNKGFHYSVSFPVTQPNGYHVEFTLTGLREDTLLLKMPRWMPGYYQIMDYAKDVENIAAVDEQGTPVPLSQVNGNSWLITGLDGKQVVVSYDIRTQRKFVAVSYVDSTLAYILPENSYLYVAGHLHAPATVAVEPRKEWGNIATGLESVPGSKNLYYASDYDILYDCPILAGRLEELPPFYVNGVEHRFMGYKLGTFDREGFMGDLKKIVQSAVDMFGEVPYGNYTFIGIGPGRGGIEHLNNTTISFDGNSLKDRESTQRVLAFIAHEYFHHFNVKRIRPFELGPFDYDRENRTNQLWISEGLTVYYEYLLLRRAGLIDETTLLKFIEGDINGYENDEGRHYQTLQQASYYTWEDGPFGTQGGEGDRSISYYQKGSVMGLLLDFQIRNETRNEHSLDDVMRYLYREYYQKKQRGFTEAEFQQACESVAGVPLASFFEYLYTTKEIDYQKYLGFAGLEITPSTTGEKAGKVPLITLSRMGAPEEWQREILTSWQEN
jgi:predicted metalloprotease with PDZ domain